MDAEHADRARLNELSAAIIGCAFAVRNTLEAGFLEKVYENASAQELHKVGFAAAQQRRVTVMYRNKAVGAYFVDLLVQGTVLLELKTIKALDQAQ